jgi:small-conductance mechanosensitive channel
MASIDPQNQPPHIQLAPIRNEIIHRAYLVSEEASRSSRLSWFYVLLLGSFVVSLVTLMSAGDIYFADWQRLTAGICLVLAALGVLVLLYLIAHAHMWASDLRVEFRYADISDAPLDAKAEAEYKRIADRVRKSVIYVRHVVTGIVIALIAAVFFLFLADAFMEVGFGGEDASQPEFTEEASPDGAETIVITSD